MKIDSKDREILYWLDVDAKQSSKDIAKKVGMSKEGVNYRIKKLIENKVITRSFADINLAKFGYTIYKMFIQFQNMTDEIEKEISDYLVNHPAGIWIASCNGRYDAIFTFRAEDIVEFEKIKNEVLARFSKYMLNRQTIINIRYVIYNRKWLIDKEELPVPTVYEGLPDKKELDDIDKKILLALNKDANTPILKLAQETGISSPQVIYRIKKLEEQKVIQAFKIDIDRKKLGYEYCKALVYLQNITPKRKDEFVKYCAGMRNIIALVDVIGPWDVELEFEVKNFEEYTQIMSRLRKDFGDIVRNFESVIITKETGRLHKIIATEGKDGSLQEEKRKVKAGRRS
jgi:DNA-binding Lrp family transcriptional regulator